MRTRPALIGCCTLAVAWMTAATVYLYPGLKEEVDEKRYIHRVEKLHTPVLPFCRVVQVVPVVPGATTRSKDNQVVPTEVSTALYPYPSDRGFPETHE